MGPLSTRPAMFEYLRNNRYSLYHRLSGFEGGIHAVAIDSLGTVLAAGGALLNSNVNRCTLTVPQIRIPSDYGN